MASKNQEQSVWISSHSLSTTRLTNTAFNLRILYLISSLAPYAFPHIFLSAALLYKSHTTPRNDIFRRDAPKTHRV